ncbi:hypothetical protein Poli38472_008019 [Pythium oligandrum]|uniref:Uncharacterized protein n=1 Tax=Pythium oligandrum TaxID=41045 RepID=A0A8K1CKX8_PYTOL|nr:hypothetical protein Poli38472_008019 [Pythium oligandrum]|eukprot:TMW65377.1 hypothetical protein Poli38472_008019 [Pythium oligandrum]
MPSQIQDFSRLHSMKIYNSTIFEWNAAAALTNTHHPVFSGFVAVRVNMSNAQLPPGLMSSDFPQSLGSIEFIETNLASLPENLDSSWPVGMVLGFESCQFSQLPPVLLRVAPSQLSFAGNLFTTFPFEAFAIPGLIYLNFDSNPIATLRPEPYRNVGIGSVRDLYPMDTTISSLPRWIDRLFQLVDEYEPLQFHNTPFCDDVLEIQHGGQSGFPATETPETELSVVMKDMVMLGSSVSCVYYEVDYPLALEDTWHT